MQGMKNQQFKEGRAKAGLTQVEAACRLGVSQPYLSQLESGQRPVTAKLARAAVALYRLPATALPMPETVSAGTAADPAKLARRFASLGYPGFAHLRANMKANPAVVVLEALLQPDLEVRLSEALPWVLLTYPDLDWQWLVDHSKRHDVQNRLGFVVAMAKAFATRHANFLFAEAKLSTVEQQLERARLVKEEWLPASPEPEQSGVPSAPKPERRER